MRRRRYSKDEFVKKIEKNCEKKIESKKEKPNYWFGLGVFGMIGWSVTVPVLIGLAIGNYLDRYHTRSVSWTLTCMFIGLLIGCVNVWYWINEKR